MPVIEQVSDQAADEGCRKDRQVEFAHSHRNSCEEDHHRHSYAAAQAIHSVGQVHSIDAAYHYKHGKENVCHRMYVEDSVHEGDIQVGGHTAL